MSSFISITNIGILTMGLFLSNSNGFLIKITSMSNRHGNITEYIFIENLSSIQDIDYCEFKDFDIINNPFGKVDGKYDIFIYNPISYNLLLNGGKRVSFHGVESMKCNEYGSTQETYGMLDSDALSMYSQLEIRMRNEQLEYICMARLKRKNDNNNKIQISLARVQLDYTECHNWNDTKQAHVKLIFPKTLTRSSSVKASDKKLLQEYLIGLDDVFKNVRLKF